MVGVTAAAALASARFFFSESFWPLPSKGASGFGITQLIESVPYPARGQVFFAPGMAHFPAARQRVHPAMQPLDIGNWWPTSGVESTYLFSAHWERLEPFYRAMVGSARVQSFGGPFSVRFEAGDWSWLQQYGWAYDVECERPQWHGAAKVPTVFHIGLNLSGPICSGTTVHRWTGRWLSPGGKMRFGYEGSEAEVVLERGEVKRTAAGKCIDFEVRTGELVSITLVQSESAAVHAFLLRVQPSGEVVPEWMAVRPEVWPGSRCGPRATTEGLPSGYAKPRCEGW